MRGYGVITQRHDSGGMAVTEPFDHGCFLRSASLLEMSWIVVTPLQTIWHRSTLHDDLGLQIYRASIRSSVLHPFSFGLIATLTPSGLTCLQASFQILICFFSLWAWKLGTICLVVSLSIFGSYLLIYSWLWPWATVHKALRQWFSDMLWPVGYMQHPEFLFSFSFLCLWTASNFILYLLSSASLFYVRSNFPYVLPIITFVWTVCNNTFRLILHSKILFFSFSLFQHHGLCCFDIVFYSSYMLSSASENRCQP